MDKIKYYIIKYRWFIPLFLYLIVFSLNMIDFSADDEEQIEFKNQTFTEKNLEEKINKSVVTDPGYNLPFNVSRKIYINDSTGVYRIHFRLDKEEVVIYNEQESKPIISFSDSHPVPDSNIWNFLSQ